MPHGHASMLLLGEGSEATEPYNKYATFSIVAIYIWDSIVAIYIWAFGKFVKVICLGLNCRGTQLTLFAFGTQFVLGLNLCWDAIVASPLLVPVNNKQIYFFKFWIR